ncbi:MAG: tRNA (guanosine(46)-N7)-methyltransferase TrmB [Bacilli bacterium]
MRIRKLKNARERLESRSDIVIFEPQLHKGRWKELFNNDNPIYLEIGMGKGQFIIKHALQNPDINYIGLEREESVLVKAVEKAEEKPNNLFFIDGDANLIMDMFSENEIDKIFLNFSDPWPKSRHSKRRLTHDKNIENYKLILKKDSFIEFKTDNRHLFEFSLKMFIYSNLEITNLSLNLHEDSEEIVTTEYEDKFVEAGNIIYFVEVKNGKHENI